MVCVAIVTAAWLAATFATKPADKQTLRNFYRLCHPGGPGWRRVVLEARADGVEIDRTNAVGDWKMPNQILCVFLGCVVIYSSLFAVGNFVYGNLVWGFILTGAVVAATIILFSLIGKIGVESGTEKQTN